MLEKKGTTKNILNTETQYKNLGTDKRKHEVNCGFFFS